MTSGNSTERLECTVKGVVQGVGFRWFVVRTATQLGVTGWAANQSDGSVRVVAEGDAAALDSLERSLHEGPSGAQVTDVTASRLPATGEFGTFGIRSGAHRGD